MIKEDHSKSFSSTAWHKYASYILLVVALLPACIFAFRKPSYNWDMLPYMAIVLSINEKNADSIHAQVYACLQQEVPAENFNLLTNANEHRRQMANSPSSFYEQISFYGVKPLYTGLCSIFYSLGISLTKATVLPSILAYVLIGLFLFYWLLRHYGIIFSITVSLLLLYSGFMISVTGGSTPDNLSAFFLFVAFYFIMEKPSVLPLFLSLLVATFVRIDNVLNAFFILSFLFFTGKWQKRISGKGYVSMLLILFLSFLFISAKGTAKGWGILYYPDFAHYFNSSYKYNSTFSFHDYAALLYAKLITGIVHSYYSVFLLFIFLICYTEKRFSFRSLSLAVSLCLLILTLIAVRFILFPDISDRFYIPYYLFISILLIMKFVPASEKPVLS